MQRARIACGTLDHGPARSSPGPARSSHGPRQARRSGNFARWRTGTDVAWNAIITRSTRALDRKELAMRAMLIVGLVVGACSMESARPPALSEITSEADECDVTRCGTNSPVIDSLAFHELSLEGHPNSQGL